MKKERERKKERKLGRKDKLYILHIFFKGVTVHKHLARKSTIAKSSGNSLLALNMRESLFFVRFWWTGWNCCWMRTPRLPSWKPIKAPGKNTKDWLTCVESIILWKNPLSGTRVHNVLSTGQEENDFSLSCVPAAQRINPILTVIWHFYKNKR